MGILQWLRGRPRPRVEEPELSDDGEPAPQRIPIDGVLDLHHFRPADLRSLVPAYLEECRKHGIHSVRIIHGKGRGQLRRSVHALLERDPWVVGYRLSPPERGGWGATLVDLKRDD